MKEETDQLLRHHLRYGAAGPIDALRRTAELIARNHGSHYPTPIGTKNEVSHGEAVEQAGMLVDMCLADETIYDLASYVAPHHPGESIDDVVKEMRHLAIEHITRRILNPEWEGPHEVYCLLSETSIQVKKLKPIHK